MSVKPEPAIFRSQRNAIARLPQELLDNQEQQFPGMFDTNTVVTLFTLRALAQRINDSTNDVLAPIGLNAAKYNYLVVLYTTPGGQLTLNEISHLIHTTNSSVTSMIGALERDGLVMRSPNPDDRRSSFIRLTLKGRKRVEQAVPLRHRDTERGMGVLSTEERAQLASMLLRVSAGFDQSDSF